MPFTAKIFRNGGSQAVRLPKSLQFDVEEFWIERIGSAVVLFPKDSTAQILASVAGQADDDFLPERQQPKRPDRRKRL